MRVVGYIRVSTNGQAEEGFGLPVQEQAIRRWAKTGKHRVVGVERDEGISGTVGVEGREGLSQALSTIAAGRAEALVVLRLDRLARELTVQEAVLAQAWRAGGRVFTVDSGEVMADDPADPMRTAMRQMMGVFAQLERGMIASRLRAGRRLKAEGGGYAFGSPPFGSRAEDGELMPDSVEREAIALAGKMRRKGASLRDICTALSEAGCKPRRGEVWHPTVVARILRREGVEAA
jgi:DNA invertase Pin-like site-specific DNA recombinase